MFNRRFFAGAAVVIAGALVPGISKASSPDPAVFIDNLDARLRQVVRNTSPEQRLAQFHQLFREDFDVPGIARFVLGRYWHQASPTQQQEFLGLFENYIVRVYADRLSRYADSGDPPRVTGSRPAPAGAIVSSQLRLANGGGPKAGGHGPTVLPVNVDWCLSTQNGSYKISDVVVDGISMAATERLEFASEIERDGGQVQALLLTLRREIAGGPR